MFSVLGKLAQQVFEHSLPNPLLPLQFPPRGVVWYNAHMPAPYVRHVVVRLTHE